MINQERLKNRFCQLVEIDSVSRREKEVATHIAGIFKALGGQVCYDNAAALVGGNCSNMVVKFAGTCNADPVFLGAHMDTVEPGEGIRVIYKDGVFRSDGTTILGADDKSAIAIIIEIMETILENGLDYPPVELIFTVCEEIGLLGAKHFDYSLMDARFGYILDSTDTQGIVTRAPAADRIDIRVTGRAAHAGARPEAGVDAISAASKAVARLALGRIDPETTCNLGTIQGGMATNIVPESVEIRGEARSHDPEKLDQVTRTICRTFEQTMAQMDSGQGLPKVEITVERDFSNTLIPEGHPVVELARRAAKSLGRSMESKTIGGGADANIFFGKGIMTGVLGTGMTDVHTLKESVRISDMMNAAELVLRILELHAGGDDA